MGEGDGTGGNNGWKRGLNIKVRKAKDKMTDNVELLDGMQSGNE